MEGSSLLGSARLHSTRLSGLLAEMGRPWRVAETLTLVASSQVQERAQRAGVLVDGIRRVAALAQARRHRVDAQLGRVHIGHLLPLKRARHTRIGHRSYRVGRGNGAVASVLVVVDEDPFALLLTPARSRSVER